MMLPDKDTTPTQWIMWAAGVLLAFALWQVPSSLNARIDAIITTQRQMQTEHRDLLKVSIIQCFNHADNVAEPHRREQQQRRCLTLQLNPD